MKIFVAGANGRVARELIGRLSRQGHTIYAGARDCTKVDGGPGIVPVRCDLHDNPDDLSTLLIGMDAVYFTAGSRGKDLLQTDAFGAVKLMQAAELAGVKRFILLSSIFATEPERWQEPGLAQLTNYNIAKFFADNWLMKNTKLDYTILQPTALVEETGTGKIQINPATTGRNSVANVAEVLAQLLAEDKTIGKVIKMSDGDQVISEALANLT